MLDMKKPYHVRFQNRGVVLDMGSYADEETAALAYDLAAMSSKSSFVIFNFPGRAISG